MTDYRNHHLTMFLPACVSGPVEAIRREWDPAMAAQIAAHATLVYPQEASDPALLLSRLRSISTAAGPFRLRLGGLSYFKRPENGVYVAVEDCDGAFLNLRDRVLRPPFERISFPPHVTVIHPRTSSRGREFWDIRSFEPPDVAFTVSEIAMTAFDGTAWATLETIRLGSTIDEYSES